MLAEYLDHMGSDLTVINAARVSFNKLSSEIFEKDKNLIQFLARGCMKSDWDNTVKPLVEGGLTTLEIEKTLKWAKNMPTHWTPFSHAMITMRETVPIFVARQR